MAFGIEQKSCEKLIEDTDHKECTDVWRDDLRLGRKVHDKALCGVLKTRKPSSPKIAKILLDLMYYAGSVEDTVGRSRIRLFSHEKSAPPET